MRTFTRLLTALISSAALGACVSASAYAPQARPGGEGYSEQRVDETHWRVEFVGDETASASIVERNLLFRAAELTRASGYDWFRPSAHSAGSDTEIVVEAPSRIEGAGPNATWGPYWRRRGASGWSNGRPSGTDPLAGARRPQPTTWSIVRYSARETIEMGRGGKPVNAFGAAAVADFLAPTIQPSH